MPGQSLSPSIVATYARIYSVEELDTGILELIEAHRTSSVTNLNVLGINVGNSKDDAENLLEYFIAAREKKTQDEDTTGAATDIANDAIEPLTRPIYRYNQIT